MAAWLHGSLGEPLIRVKYPKAVSLNVEIQHYANIMFIHAVGFQLDSPLCGNRYDCSPELPI